MEELKPYYAHDRRIYNNTPCSDMQKEIDWIGKLLEKIKSFGVSLYVAYFPSPEDEGYMVFVDHKPLTNKIHKDVQEALIDAIKFLEKENKKEMKGENENGR